MMTLSRSRPPERFAQFFQLMNNLLNSLNLLPRQIFLSLLSLPGTGLGHISCLSALGASHDAELKPRWRALCYGWFGAHCSHVQPGFSSRVLGWMGSSLPFASLLCLPRVALSSGVPGVNAFMVLTLSVVTLLHHGYLGSRCSAGAPWCGPRVSPTEGRLGWCLCPPPSPATGGPFLPGVTSCYPHKFPLGWLASELPLVRVPHLLASPFEGRVPVTTVVFTTAGQTHTALTLPIGESKLLGAHLLPHFPPALSLLFSSPALAPRGRNHVHIYFAQTATLLEVRVQFSFLSSPLLTVSACRGAPIIPSRRWKPPRTSKAG